ncbi:hypothetical protein [Pseudonocardia sp. Ae717_Ps2]|uniref:hypothetical protein n=1 Tax=Pseudonocardia sp. Ae717_Ps2 TaxID=1885573 RepID=UPI001179ADCF|nr:hypothetical protein [Pseudonocardia sp. Ae717_Ps2]
MAIEPVLGPADSAVPLDFHWEWKNGMMSPLIEQLELMDNSSELEGARYSLLAGAMTGGYWLLKSRPARVNGRELQSSGMYVSFTDAAGIRWARDPFGDLYVDSSQNSRFNALKLKFRAVAQKVRETFAGIRLRSKG